MYCIDTDKTVIAEVLSITDKKYLSVSINRSVKVELLYQPRHNIYVGSQAGLEFTSSGPEFINTKRNYYKR